MQNPDTRLSYIVSMEVGLILALSTAITAFNLDIERPEPPVFEPPPVDLIDITEVPAVRLHKQAPPPPRPAIPVAVEDNEIFDTEELILDPIRYEPPVDIGPPPVEPAPDESDEVVEFHLVEEEPQLIGGLAGLQHQMRYPDLARRAGIQGRVFVEFVVDKDGSVTDLTLVNGIGGGCDEEALRVLREARFTPGRQRMKPVRVKMSLSIAFRLR